MCKGIWVGKHTRMCVCVHITYEGKLVKDLEMNQNDNCLQMENQALCGTLFQMIGFYGVSAPLTVFELFRTL